jgi:hypothetical protein
VILIFLLLDIVMISSTIGTMSENKDYNGPDYPTEAYGSIPVLNSYEEEAELGATLCLPSPTQLFS